MLLFEKSMRELGYRMTYELKRLYNIHILLGIIFLNSNTVFYY